ncbi:hypothetical protein [Comamonas kerstersii]
MVLKDAFASIFTTYGYVRQSIDAFASFFIFCSIDCFKWMQWHLFLYVASRWHAGLTVMHNAAAPKNRRITMEIHSDMALPVWGMRNGH